MRSEKRIFDALVRFVAEEAQNSPYLLVPISGGSDGALSLKICQEACPRKTIAIHAGNDLLCRDWFESICPLEIIPTPPNLPAYGSKYYRDQKTYGVEEQRWAHFLARSIQLKGRLIGNRNRNEDLLGNYSLASMWANLLPIVNVWKSDVMSICQYVGVPKEILAKSLRPDPDCGRPAELAAIPFHRIETYLKSKIGEKFDKNELSQLSRPEKDYLYALMRRNEFKSKLPIRGPKL